MLVIGFAIQRFISFANSTTEYQEHFSGSCQKIYGVVGGEDITISKKGIAWISAYDRRAVAAAAAVAAVDTAAAGEKVRGKIFSLDLNARKPKLIERTPNNLPPFFPHGISLLQNSDGTGYLFAVNHPAPNKHNIVRFAVSATNQLTLNGLFTAGEIKSPNDIVAVSPDQFYWTNDLNAEPNTLSQLLEIILALPGGSLGFFDGKEARIVHQGFAFANGVNVSADGKQIYVAATGERSLYIFDRNEQTNALSLNRTISIPSGIDNLELDSEGNLWTAAHPKPLLFGAHAESNENKAPSQVFQVFLNQNRAKEIYYNHGSALSGAATAAVYKNRMLLGPVFDDHLLLCERR